ncbi:MAG: hypothetical protein HY617_00160 [Candidatus Sungbacteria bacterium]|nr:hypothetical protein [Candidatus Sungbacteria bacterium]
MIPEYIQKVKGLLSENKSDVLTAAIIFLIGMASFGLGRLSVSLPQRELIRLEDPASSREQAAEMSAEPMLKDSSDIPVPAALKNGAFVASKSGSVYYAVWCSGVSRIREENKVWFQTKEDAKAQGYRPAKNCPGL